VATAAEQCCILSALMYWSRCQDPG